MRAVYWMGKALLAGGLALVTGSCATNDKTRCTCEFKDDITRTETVETVGTCTQLEVRSAQYSTCFEASGSIIGPSSPITLQIRKPYEFPTTLLPGQGTEP